MTTPPELRMVAVNMAKSRQDVMLRAYLCPSLENDFQTGYVHYPAKYLACFVNGGAKHMGEVEACVRLHKSGGDEVLWKFKETPDEELFARAREAQKKTVTGNKPPCLVFLLSSLTNTDFQYDSRGGLQSSRIYFDVSSLHPNDLKDLSAKLRGTSWAAMPRWKPA